MNSDLIREWFESDAGDRWKAPSGAGGDGGGVGGGFGGGERVLTYPGDNPSRCQALYELKTSNSENPWIHLIHAAHVLNRTATNELRAKVDDVLAVDRWPWFLALENVFADEHSYWNKGADYELYYEPETGRLHPLEYDGNEALMTGDVRLTLVQGAGNVNRGTVNCRQNK